MVKSNKTTKLSPHKKGQSNSTTTTPRSSIATRSLTQSIADRTRNRSSAQSFSFGSNVSQLSPSRITKSTAGTDTASKKLPSLKPTSAKPTSAACGSILRSEDRIEASCVDNVARMPSGTSLRNAVENNSPVTATKMLSVYKKANGKVKAAESPASRHKVRTIHNKSIEQMLRTPYRPHKTESYTNVIVRSGPQVYRLGFNNDEMETVVKVVKKRKKETTGDKEEHYRYVERTESFIDIFLTNEVSQDTKKDMDERKQKLKEVGNSNSKTNEDKEGEY